MRPDVIRGNVFVANLPIGFTDEQLAELFDPHGMVLRAYMARDPATGETQGHGLVELAPDRVVDAAIEAVSAARPGGRRVDVRRADSTMGIVAKRPPRAPRPPREAEVEMRGHHRPVRELEVVNARDGFRPPREAIVRRYDESPSRSYGNGPSRPYNDGPSRSYNDGPSRTYNDGPSRPGRLTLRPGFRG